MIVRIYTQNIIKNKIEKSIFLAYEMNIQVYSWRKEITMIIVNIRIGEKKDMVYFYP